MVLFLLIIPIFIIIGVLVFVFRHPIRKFAREKYTQYFSTFPASVPEGQNRASTSPKRHQPQSGKDNRRDRYSFKPGTAVSSSQQSQFAANSKSEKLFSLIRSLSLHRKEPNSILQRPTFEVPTKMMKHSPILLG